LQQYESPQETPGSASSHGTVEKRRYTFKPALAKFNDFQNTTRTKGIDGCRELAEAAERVDQKKVISISDDAKSP